MSALAAVKAFYAAVAKGDVPGVIASLHPQLQWTEAEGFPYYSGTWQSPNEVVEKLLVPISRDWEEFAAVPHDFIESGSRVVALGAYSGRSKATGKLMHAPFAHVWTIRDGKLARFDMYTDTALVNAALLD